MRVSYYFFFLFLSDCTPFTDSSVAGHNILHKLNSTVSCRQQTLRQEATFRCEVLKLLFHLSLKDITVYINDINFFAVKAYYSMVTDNEIYFVADFHSMNLQSTVYSLQSRLLFSCGSAKSSNFQINAFSRYKSLRISAQLQRSYRDPSLHYL